MPEHVYGPVPSRRLGRSLGVDLVPLKTCDFDCLYCQLGRADRTTLERAEYVPVEEVLAEARERLETCAQPDYVTLAGSGEPTLHARFGDVARGVREFSQAPLALLTNGSLFDLPEVRADCRGIDLVLPSLDAGDEETFRRINRPHPELTFERLVGGLQKLRDEFAGQLWLEVFVVPGINDSDEQIERIRRQIARINPHRIQINAAVRPPAEAEVEVPTADRLEQIRDALGPSAEIIAPIEYLEEGTVNESKREEVLAMLRRRPCSVSDIAGGLGIHPNEAAKHLWRLIDEGLVRRRQRLYDTFYEATPAAR